MAGTYGDKAAEVAKLAKFTGKRWPVVGRKLVDEFPYLEADVKYAVKEYACTAVDVLARRTRLAFLHVHAADEALPKIVSIMAKELGWSKARMKVHQSKHIYSSNNRHLLVWSISFTVINWVLLLIIP